MVLNYGKRQIRLAETDQKLFLAILSIYHACISSKMDNYEQQFNIKKPPAASQDFLLEKF